MLKGLVFELTIPCTNLHPVYLAVSGFEGPTLCHLGYHPAKGCRTASTAGISEVVYVGGGIAVPTLRELDCCYQPTSTSCWCIGKSLYRSRSPALPLDPACLINQHLSRVRECHHSRRCHTTPIVRIRVNRYQCRAAVLVKQWTPIGRLVLCIKTRGLIVSNTVGGYAVREWFGPGLDMHVMSKCYRVDIWERSIDTALHHEAGPCTRSWCRFSRSYRQSDNRCRYKGHHDDQQQLRLAIFCQFSHHSPQVLRSHKGLVDLLASRGADQRSYPHPPQSRTLIPLSHGTRSFYRSQHEKHNPHTGTSADAGDLTRCTS